MGGIGIWQLVIVAVIVVLLFGTKKLRNIGGDLGSAIKGFKKAIAEDKEPKNNVEVPSDTLVNNTIDAKESTSKQETKDTKSKEHQA
jgi:sec-independent protein translocase protein TatA